MPEEKGSREGTDLKLFLGAFNMQNALFTKKNCLKCPYGNFKW